MRDACAGFARPGRVDTSGLGLRRARLGGIVPRTQTDAAPATGSPACRPTLGGGGQRGRSRIDRPVPVSHDLGSLGRLNRGARPVVNAHEAGHLTRQRPGQGRSTTQLPTTSWRAFIHVGSPPCACVAVPGLDGGPHGPRAFDGLLTEATTLRGLPLRRLSHLGRLVMGWPVGQQLGTRLGVPLCRSSRARAVLSPPAALSP